MLEPPVRTIKLTIEYDGTAFKGWQLQKELPPEDTVQGALQQALESMCQKPVRLRGASRTDAGVHARGQVAAFTTDRDRITLTGFQRGLSRLTTPDVCVRKAELMPFDWDPKYMSRGKRYRYTIWNDPAPTSIDRLRAWWVPRALDLQRMQAAAQHLVGAHDFEAFRSSGCSAKHAIRRIYDIQVIRGDYEHIHIVVVGNAFVRNMVRIIAGNLAEVGFGALSPDDLRVILESKDRTRGGVTAPGHGLSLEEVIYDDRLPPRPIDNADVIPA